MKKVLLFMCIIVMSIIGMSEIISFTILHTNDEHSSLLPTPLLDNHETIANETTGGFARLSGMVNQIRNKRENVLLVSSGDYIGGPAFAWLALYGYSPEISLMQKIGYNAVTIGNHEYDYGPDILAEYYANAGYPEAQNITAIVASNSIFPDGHPLNFLGIKKNHILSINDNFKIGFIGLMGEDAERVAPYAAPVKFEDRIISTRNSVNYLKTQGADVIILLGHTGYGEDEIIAQNVDGIDVIISGHSHTVLHKPNIVNNTIIAQTGAYLNNLGNLIFEYNTNTKELNLVNEKFDEPYLIPLDYTVPSDPIIEKEVEYYTMRLNEIIYDLTNGSYSSIFDIVLFSENIITNRPRLEETPMGNFVADAMRLQVEKALGKRVDLAVQANGVIRGAITPSNMPYSKDKVSFYDLIELVGLGFGPELTPGYPMVSIYLTGEEIRRVMEISILLSEMYGDTYFLQYSGANFEYSTNRTFWFRIPFTDTRVPSTKSILKAELFVGEGIQNNNETIELKKTDDNLYHVVTDYYLAAFLPFIGEVLPSLELILKDEDGNEVKYIEDLIIYNNDMEYKVWQAVLEYASNQVEINGKNFINDYYTTTHERMVRKETTSLLFWPILGTITAAAAVGLYFFLK